MSEETTALNIDREKGNFFYVVKYAYNARLGLNDDVTDPFLRTPTKNPVRLAFRNEGTY